MVQSFGDDLIDTGYAMCSFHYDGATGEAVTNATIAAGKYDVIQADSFSTAAERHFCLNVDPCARPTSHPLPTPRAASLLIRCPPGAVDPRHNPAQRGDTASVDDA